MKHSDNIANLAAALVKAQSEMKAVVKDSQNPAFKSTYASLEATVDAVRPILSKHGLAVMQGEANPETDEGRLTGFNVETVVLHQSGEWMSNAVFVPVEKPSAQGAVSALTYGRRAGLRAVFTLADTDDDGEMAQNHAPRAQAARSAPESTSRPAPSRQASNAGGPVMPFGKTKGTPLALLEASELEGALKWAREKDKFVEFQFEAEAELAKRGVAVPPTREDSYRGGEESELPF